ncbi:MAG: PepSY-associated TM helix domain-containing protein, partial [Cyclobacteriaceae bacterium]
MLTTRKIIRNIHLWLGLVSGLVLSVVGVTGSIYVFEPELASLLSADTYLVQSDSSLFKDDVALAAAIEEQTGEKIESLQWPQRGRETYAFKLFDDNRWYYFDQTTGKVIKGEELFGNAFFAFILKLHRTLTLGDIGYWITATSSLIFGLFMLTTGLYLWWPRVRARLKSSFRIKWNASPKRLNYDLHNVTGFYFFIPLFLMGITGSAFYYHDEAQWVVDKVTFSEPAPVSVWTSQFSDTTRGLEPLSISQALVEMNKHYPTYHKRNLWLTSSKERTLSFAYQKYKHVHAGPDERIFLRADRYTGEILGEQNPDKLPRGAAIMAQWLLPVHFGEFGGLLTRIIWFFAGFIPALLTYTGIVIWLGRRKKGKKSSRKKSRKKAFSPKNPAEFEQVKMRG